MVQEEQFAGAWYGRAAASRLPGTCVLPSPCPRVVRREGGLRAGLLPGTERMCATATSPAQVICPSLTNHADAPLGLGWCCCCVLSLAIPGGDGDGFRCSAYCVGPRAGPDRHSEEVANGCIPKKGYFQNLSHSVRCGNDLSAR